MLDVDRCSNSVNNAGSNLHAPLTRSFYVNKVVVAACKSMFHSSLEESGLLKTEGLAFDLDASRKQLTYYTCYELKHLDAISHRVKFSTSSPIASEIQQNPDFQKDNRVVERLIVYRLAQTIFTRSNTHRTYFVSKSVSPDGNYVTYTMENCRSTRTYRLGIKLEGHIALYLVVKGTKRLHEHNFGSVKNLDAERGDSTNERTLAGSGFGVSGEGEKAAPRRLPDLSSIRSGYSGKDYGLGE